MSFFCDVFKDCDAVSVDKKIRIFVVFGEKVFVVGKVKVAHLSSEKIVLKNTDSAVIIHGDNLYIKTMSKGEILICGDVKNVGCEDKYD